MNHPAIPYILPFVCFLVFLSLDGQLGLSPEVEYPLRVALLGAILAIFSRRVIDFKVRNWGLSIGAGFLVFLIWIGPDLLWPGYRRHWLFENSLLGAAPAPTQGYASLSAVAILFRTVRAALIVPIVEELFWRGWLMRWIIDLDFRNVALGTYRTQAFCVTAALFAAEHGSFWAVGFVAGAIYNWLIVRTKSLADCILAHAVTNAVLSAYVLLTGRYEYW